MSVRNYLHSEKKDERQKTSKLELTRERNVLRLTLVPKDRFLFA